MRTWSLRDDPGRSKTLESFRLDELTLLLDGEEFACVHWAGDDDTEIAQFVVDACNFFETVRQGEEEIRTGHSVQLSDFIASIGTKKMEELLDEGIDNAPGV